MLSTESANLSLLAGDAWGRLGMVLFAQDMYADCLPIFEEAERMAGIVRKLGSLTRYETKSYVGNAQILDIDRSAENFPPATEPGKGKRE